MIKALSRLYATECLQRLQSQGGILMLLAIGVAALFVGGCAKPETYSKSQRLDDFLQPPSFLVAPLSAFLTNAQDGFSARVDLIEPRTDIEKSKSGQLLGRGNRLFYVPDLPAGIVSKRHENEHASFIWDVSEARGYVLNEALQGYASVSGPAKPAKVSVADPANAVFENINGMRCRRVEAQVELSDGSSAPYTVWQSTELKGFPMQIKSGNGQLTLTLSKIKVEQVSSRLFLVPDGFVKFASPDAMTGELLERQLRMKNKEPGAWNRTPPEFQAGPGSRQQNPYGPE